MTYRKKTLISLSATVLASVFLVAANSVNADEIGAANGKATCAGITTTIDESVG